MAFHATPDQPTLFSVAQSISDLPDDQRPREKLLAHGVEALKDEELLAIFIRTGLPGKSAIAIAKELLDQNQSLATLAQMDARHLSARPGIGPAKAAQILAAFELGARASYANVESFPLADAPLIYGFASRRMMGLRQESLQVICLDSQLNFQSMHEVTRGSADKTLAEPRDILQPVISRQAPAFIIIHNHPSGVAQPSYADKELTKRLCKAAEIMNLRFIDHLIIGRPLDTKSPYYSFAQDDDFTHLPL